MATRRSFIGGGIAALSSSAAYALPSAPSPITVYKPTPGVFNLDALGCIPDGKTPASRRIQEIYDEASADGGTIVGTGPYYMDAPIDCTSYDGSNKGVVWQTLNPCLNAASGFVLHHDSHGFDCTGNWGIQFVDVTISTPDDPSVIPETAILFAKNHSNGGLSRLIRPRILGAFSAAAIYNYAVEQMYIEAGYVCNTVSSAARCIVLTASNVLGIQSIVPNLIGKVTHSLTVTDMIACNWSLPNADAESDAIYLETVSGLNVFGGWIGAKGARSGIYIDNSGEPCSNVSVDGLRFEQIAPAPTYGILLGAASRPQTHVGVSVTNTKFVTGKHAIAAHDAHTTLNGLTLRGNTESTSNGVAIPGSIDGYSRLELGPMPMSAGHLSSDSYIWQGGK